MQKYIICMITVSSVKTSYHINTYHKSLFIAFVDYFETADWLTRAAAIIHIIELILQIFQFQSVSRFDYLSDF